MSALGLGLALVVHRQWAHHEHLPYPIVQFGRSLLDVRENGRPTVFTKRLFWLGLSIVLLIHLNNYLHSWFPKHTVQIRTLFDLSPVLRLFPNFQRGGGGWMLNYYSRIFFAAFGIAYFLDSDVSFSVGIAPFVYFTVRGILWKYGIPFSEGGYLQPTPERFLFFGAGSGIFLVFLYTGRHYYKNVLLHAFRLPSRESMDRQAVWGARVFFIAISLFALQLILVGVSWPVALMFSFFSVVFFAVIGRATAETGVFLFQSGWYPCGIVAGLFGANALGLRNLFIMSFVSVLLVTEGREILMPYMVNSLKLVGSFKARVGKVAGFCILSLVIGLVVALSVTLFFQYDIGPNYSDGWAVNGPTRFAFNQLIRTSEKLEGQGTAETAGSARGFAMFGKMEPDLSLISAALIGLGLAAGLSICRLRFSWWPLHPIMLLVCNTWAGFQLAWSFLAGWLFKLLVVKYGGSKTYQRLKFIMFGIIAGDLLGGFLPFVVGLGYYIFTGKLPPLFAVTPG